MQGGYIYYLKHSSLNNNKNDIGKIRLECLINKRKAALKIFLWQTYKDFKAALINIMSYRK